jgi:hypothetical protein
MGLLKTCDILPSHGNITLVALHISIAVKVRTIGREIQQASFSRVMQWLLGMVI